MSIGSVLYTQRIRAGLSQVELGKYMGRKHNAVGAWEREERDPNPRDIRKLCKLYGITPNQLFEVE